MEKMLEYVRKLLAFCLSHNLLIYSLIFLLGEFSSLPNKCSRHYFPASFFSKGKKRHIDHRLTKWQ